MSSADLGQPRSRPNTEPMFCIRLPAFAGSVAEIPSPHPRPQWALCLSQTSWLQELNSRFSCDALLRESAPRTCPVPRRCPVPETAPERVSRPVREAVELISGTGLPPNGTSSSPSESVPSHERVPSRAASPDPPTCPVPSPLGSKWAGAAATPSRTDCPAGGAGCSRTRADRPLLRQ
jgi:hypothetical protein